MRHVVHYALPLRQGLRSVAHRPHLVRSGGHRPHTAAGVAGHTFAAHPPLAAPWSCGLRVRRDARVPADRDRASAYPHGVLHDPALVCSHPYARVVFVAVTRRWRPAVFLTVVMSGELGAFLTIAAVVKRPRPDVPHLDSRLPTSAFPSGHKAATACCSPPSG